MPAGKLRVTGKALPVLLKFARFCVKLGRPPTPSPGSVAIRLRLSGFQGFPLMLWSEGSCEDRRPCSRSIGSDPGLRQRKAMALPIEDYALIGDCKTAALVGRDGSVDWLCWPRFDSAACFAALLGEAKNGRWLIAASDLPLCVSRRYRPGTLVLETEFQTETGSAAVIDFMPPGDGADLVRIVIGRSGRVVFRTELVVRFNYGATVPWVDRVEGGALAAIAGQERLLLRTPVALYGEDLRTVGEFAVEAGQSIPFVLSYGPSSRPPPPALDCFRSAGAHGSILARLERPLSRGWGLDRRGQTLAHHIEGLNLRPDWGNRRRCDDLTSREPRRRQELGLPLLLAARRHLYAPGVHKSRLLRRGAGVARLAFSGNCRQPEPDPDHVRGGWREMAAGADRPLVARIRELGSGADWQWRIPATATRRRRRGRRRDVSRAESRHGAIATRAGLAARCLGLSGNGVAPTRRRHLGGARRPAALCSFEGHGLGRVRSRGK